MPVSGGQPLPLVLTMGEPAGIGGEITLKSWLRRQEGVPPFAALDDPDRLERLAGHLGLSIPLRVIEYPAEVSGTWADALPVIATPLARPVKPGILDDLNEPAVLQSIDRAVHLVQQGRAAALVTNPIQKSALHNVGFAYPGHTEYLAALAGGDLRPVMMIANPELRVIPVTIHLALTEAIAALSTALIVETARITAAALRRDFGIAAPRLAIAGLNPHAGEAGDFGDEEIRLIAPAIAQLRAEGIDAFGPMVPDALFHPRARTGYDAAICMYHDQALIPAKTIDFDNGVNVTLGLPFIRTSPDHGTALDIAGKNVALPDSLMAALRLARHMADARSRTPARP